MNNKITTKINVKDNLIGVMRINNKDYANGDAFRLHENSIKIGKKS